MYIQMHTDGISIYGCTHTRMCIQHVNHFKDMGKFRSHENSKPLWSSLSDVGRNIYFPNYVFL